MSDESKNKLRKNHSAFTAMVARIIVDIAILKNTSYTFNLLTFYREWSNEILI